MTPPTKPYYPLTTRLLLALYHEGALPQIAQITIEPDYGYVGRIVYRDGSVRLYRSSNPGVNNHGAAEISKDKGYTRFFLASLGYHIPAGRTFLTSDYIRYIDSNLSNYDFDSYHRDEDALAFIQAQIGYPCFIKPVDGSMGKGIRQCQNPDDVLATITSYQQTGVDVFLVEARIPYPDYRIVVYEESVFAAYRRTPLSITGDGQTPVQHLIEAAQTQFRQQGRKAFFSPDDARILQRLAQQGYTPQTILPAGQSLQLFDIANASAGGSLDDVTGDLHPDWQTLCVRLTRDMGLTFCGVDLACDDITDPDSDYAILEINASPGLTNYAACGDEQRSRVKWLYKQMFHKPAG